MGNTWISLGDGNRIDFIGRWRHKWDDQIGSRRKLRIEGKCEAEKTGIEVYLRDYIET